MEQNNNFTVDFDQNAINPLNSPVTMPIDPVTGSATQMQGRPHFRRRRTARRRRRAISRQSRRRRASARSTASTTRRCCAAARASTTRPWNYPCGRHRSGARSGYSATTTCRRLRACRRRRLSNPFPGGLQQPSRQHARSADRRGRRHLVRRPERRRRRACSSTRPTSSASCPAT